jgi:hypothetical protein
LVKELSHPAPRSARGRAARAELLFIRRWATGILRQATDCYDKGIEHTGMIPKATIYAPEEVLY